MREKTREVERKSDEIGTAQPERSNSRGEVILEESEMGERAVRAGMRRVSRSIRDLAGLGVFDR